jgi:uncharacterized protein
VDVGHDYRLPFKGLQEGSYRYQFDLPGSFFEQFSSEDLGNADLKAEVHLIKRSSFLELKVEIVGYLEVICDRCLEFYKQNLKTEGHLFIKFGEIQREESDELIVIPQTDTDIDLSQYLYEFVLLGIPFRRVHPDEPNGTEGCDPDMIKRLKELSVDKTEETDHRWDKLKELNIKKK